MTDNKGYNFTVIVILCVAITLMVISYIIDKPITQENINNLISFLLITSSSALVGGIVTVLVFGFWEQARRDEINQTNSLMYNIFTKEVVDTVMTQIMRVKLIMRKDLRLNIHLSKYDPNCENLVLLQCHIKYKLKNQYNYTVPLNIEHTINQIVLGFQPKITEFKIGPNENLKTIDTENYLSTKKQSTFLKYPYKISANNEICVELKYEKLLRDAETFIWSSKFYVMGLNCKVIVDRSLLLDVEGELLSEGGNTIITSNFDREYELDADDRIFLPYQGVQIRWTPKLKDPSLSSGIPPQLTTLSQ